MINAEFAWKVGAVMEVALGWREDSLLEKFEGDFGSPASAFCVSSEAIRVMNSGCRVRRDSGRSISASRRMGGEIQLGVKAMAGPMAEMLPERLARFVWPYTNKPEPIASEIHGQVALHPETPASRRAMLRVGSCRGERQLGKSDILALRGDWKVCREIPSSFDHENGFADAWTKPGVMTLRAIRFENERESPPAKGQSQAAARN